MKLYLTIFLGVFSSCIVISQPKNNFDKPINIVHSKVWEDISSECYETQDCIGTSGECANPKTHCEEFTKVQNRWKSISPFYFPNSEMINPKFLIADELTINGQKRNFIYIVLHNSNKLWQYEIASMNQLINKKEIIINHVDQYIKSCRSLAIEKGNILILLDDEHSPGSRIIHYSIDVDQNFDLNSSLSTNYIKTGYTENSTRLNHIACIHSNSEHPLQLYYIKEGQNSIYQGRMAPRNSNQLFTIQDDYLLKTNIDTTFLMADHSNRKWYVLYFKPNDPNLYRATIGDNLIYDNFDGAKDAYFPLNCGSTIVSTYSKWIRNITSNRQSIYLDIPSYHPLQMPEFVIRFDKYSPSGRVLNYELKDGTWYINEGDEFDSSNYRHTTKPSVVWQAISIEHGQLLRQGKPFEEELNHSLSTGLCYIKPKHEPDGDNMVWEQFTADDKNLIHLSKMIKLENMASDDWVTDLVTELTDNSIDEIFNHLPRETTRITFLEYLLDNNIDEYQLEYINQTIRNITPNLPMLDSKETVITFLNMVREHMPESLKPLFGMAESQVLTPFSPSHPLTDIFGITFSIPVPLHVNKSELSDLITLNIDNSISANSYRNLIEDNQELILEITNSLSEALENSNITLNQSITDRLQAIVTSVTAVLKAKYENQLWQIRVEKGNNAQIINNATGKFVSRSQSIGHRIELRPKGDLPPSFQYKSQNLIFSSP